MPPVAKDFSTMAGRVAYLVERSGVSVREFARKAGLSGGHVNTYLSRARVAPEGELSAASARKIAKAWGADYAWLATGEGDPPSVPTTELEAPPADLTGPGRWKQYAARYWAFRAEASIALANGCHEAALDAASDALGARHGDGPTEDEARIAIERYRARIKPVRLDGEEASEDDFWPPPPPRRGKR